MQPPPWLIQTTLGPPTAEDAKKLIAAIEELTAVDATLFHAIDEDARYFHLRGSSEMQLDSAIHRLKSQYCIDFAVGSPEVAYLERLAKKITVDYTHQKRFGGKGQFARVRILFEPNKEDAGYRFDTALGAAVFPDKYVDGIRRGVETALSRGVRAGFPVVDVRATALDGAWHKQDSSVLAFEIAARAAAREALQKGGCTLMEPIARLEITSPPEYEGVIDGDMRSRRGAIIDRVQDGDTLKLVALAPYGNLFGYPNQLRAFTLGRGEHCMSFAHYADMPEETPRNPDGTFPPAIGKRMSA